MYDDDSRDEIKKWIEKPILGQYSPLDFARTGLAIIFIGVCMSALTLYVHHQIDTVKNDSVVIEYINMAREDVYDEENGIIVAAPDLIIDRILEFPVAYNKYGTHAYILRDKSPEAGGARYLYVHNDKGIAITRYWNLSELELFKSHVHHELTPDQQSDIIERVQQTEE